jgi:hypothetical protein
MIIRGMPAGMIAGAPPVAAVVASVTFRELRPRRAA